MFKKIVIGTMILSFAFVISILILQPTQIFAAVLSPGTISTCGDITSAGTYTLSADVGSGGTCFTISVGGVTINGDGHTVTGDINGNGPDETPGNNFTLSNITVDGNVSAAGGPDAGLGFGPGYGGNITIINSTVGTVTTDAGATGSSGGNSAGSITINNSTTGVLYASGSGNPFGSGGNGGTISITSSGLLNISTLSIQAQGGMDFGFGSGVDGTLSLHYTDVVTSDSTSFSSLSNFSLNGVSQGAFVGGTYNDFPDASDPDVSLTSPSNGTTVGGSVLLTATASDDKAVSGVQFKIDGASEGSEDTTSTYGTTWDSTGVSDGSHTIDAVARDVVGKYATSTITVMVDNTGPVISEVTPVTTPGTSTTPSYTFTTNEAGTISYGGSCASDTTSVTSGSNTIIFSTLATGTYSDCTIIVTDTAGNDSNTLAITSFTINNPPASHGSTISGSRSNRSRTTTPNIPIITAPSETTTQVQALQKPPFIFNNDIKFGTEFSEDTRRLQKFLNQNGFTVNITGAGSSGKETSYFGPSTWAALIRFQLAHNITPSIGYFGPKTRAFINSL